MNPILKFNAVGYQASDRTILSDIDFEIGQNQITSVIGPNGAGKTTLVKIAAGLLKPSKGKVTRQSGLRVAYVPQAFELAKTLPLSVADFLASNSNVSSVSLEQALSLAQLDIERSTSAHVLSGGEMQKLLLARAILSAPQLLILDEPAQGYDQALLASFYHALSSIRSELECSILLVSHELNLVMSATDHVVCLNTHVCCEGKPSDISTAPEFLSLFGSDKVSQQFAVYQHSHDHSHDLDGSIINEHEHK